MEPNETTSLIYARIRATLNKKGVKLPDPDYYRRDRRKDALLQQDGYFVLRFLAEDVGKQLDHILDTILATLAHQIKDRD